MATGSKAAKWNQRWGDPARQIAEAELLYPETAMAIALLETGRFSARRMMKTHNWFGFRATKRGYQMRVARGYGVYASGQMMLRDYVAWETEMTSRYDLNTKAKWRAWVKTHYAEDPQYGPKLTRVLADVDSTWH